MKLSARFASHALVLLIALGGAQGCMSRPAATFEFPKETPKSERIAKDPAPPTAMLVDVDGLRAQLERVVPAGWSIQEPDDQIDAPRGWERIEGPRGMAVQIVDHRKAGAGSFTLYLFPHGWTGRDVGQGIGLEGDKIVPLKKSKAVIAKPDDPVVFYGASRDWLFFHATKGQAPGAGQATVPAGWPKPEDDVARALSITK
jgi:hypothetical protein